MPGKWDTHTPATEGGLGQTFPGANEGKAWKDGYEYRYSGAALSVPITNNPFTQAESPAEYQQWRDGWNTANGNSTGIQYGPNVPAGAPPA